MIQKSQILLLKRKDVEVKDNYILKIIKIIFILVNFIFKKLY